MASKVFYSKAISQDLGLLILRLVSGGFMITHGLPKLQKVLAGDLAFGDPIGIGATLSLYLAVFAEFVCGILVVLGLATRLALVPLMITMTVAFFIVHSPDPFNVKELAGIYLGMFVTLFLAGPGKYSIDQRL